MGQQRGGLSCIALVVTLCAATGCTNLREHKTDSARGLILPSAFVAEASSPLSEDSRNPDRVRLVQQKPLEEEEPYDPFQTEEERALLEEYDPWEPFNAIMFEFNRKLDRYVIKQAATVYDKILPDEVELGIRNAFHNARVVPRLINNLLQGKFKGAGIEAARFLINSSFGIGGLFDFAKEVFDLDAPDEDTGQTLGFYGIKPGPYLVLPFLPPLTLRDAFGYAGDYMLDPINYFVFAVIRVGQPALVTHQTTATLGWFGMRAGEIVNERSINLELFQGVEEGTVDLYGAVRNAYLQRRARQIRE